jgi:transcriptional regulator with XRE-family HTH domain/protein gp37
MPSKAPEALDYALAARQLLRAIRGKRSQIAFARRLGFRGNPIADWEAGRRAPTARRVLRACRSSGIDVPAALRRFHPVEPPSIDDAASFAAWLDGVRGKTSITDLAKQSGCSRHQLSRWLSGRAEPRLHEWLRALDAMTGRVSDLVAELVPIESVPSMQRAHVRREAARQLAYDEPWTEAILRVIEASAYRALPAHRPGFIAECLGTELATETRCLHKLLRAGLIRRVGARYRTFGALTVDTRSVAALKAHWTRTALARVTEPGPDDLFSYNVFSASIDDMNRIKDLLRATYRQIRAIVSSTPADERVALLNLQLLHWPRSIGEVGPAEGKR